MLSFLQNSKTRLNALLFSVTHMKLLLFGCAMSWIVCRAGAAEVPCAQLLYMVEVYTLPHEMAYELTSQSSKGPELHARLLESVKAKTATLSKLMLLKSRRDLGATLKQIESYEYPTEFDPPQVVQTLALVDPGPKSATQALPAADPGKEALSPLNAGLGTISTTTPTAFEMRELGDSLEITGSMLENRELTSYKLSSTELMSVVTAGDIPQPVFSSRHLEGTVQLKAGQPAFLGTYSPAKKSGAPNENPGQNASLAFLTARSAPVPKPEELPVVFTYPSLRLTLEIVSMDKYAAHSLMLESLDDVALSNRVAALIDQQQAVRETTLAVRTKPTQRTTVRNADELIAPTEFDPPQVIGNLIIANRELLKDLRAGKQTGIGTPPAMEGGNPNGGFGFITTLSPTAFEMHPLGESAEFEFTETEQGLEVTLGVEMTRLSGTVPYTGIDHPVVETRAFTTSVYAIEGRRVLLGTLNKPLNTGFAASNQLDRIWLAFLRVSAK